MLVYGPRCLINYGALGDNDNHLALAGNETIRWQSDFALT